jgi:AraC-like DNA-binding protein
MSLINQEILRGLEFKILSIQRTVAGRWWNFKNVTSPFSRLWLVLEGQAEVKHHGRRFVLKPGSLHLVPPYTTHDCLCNGMLNHYHLHFVARLNTGVDLFSLLDCEFQQTDAWSFEALFAKLETLHPNQKLPCFDPAREEYRIFSRTAERGAHEMSTVTWFETNGLLSLILAPFIKTARMHEGVHARVARQFMAVQGYIHQGIRRPLTLGDLASAAGLHPTYFSDRFKRLVGERPLAYLMRYRLERAQLLLLTTHMTVKEVAYEVGISDPAYFSRAFSRFWGVSPTQYRTNFLSP